MTNADDTAATESVLATSMRALILFVSFFVFFGSIALALGLYAKGTEPKEVVASQAVSQQVDIELIAYSGLVSDFQRQPKPWLFLERDTGLMMVNHSLGRRKFSVFITFKKTPCGFNAVYRSTFNRVTTEVILSDVTENEKVVKYEVTMKPKTKLVLPLSVDSDGCVEGIDERIFLGQMTTEIKGITSGS